MQRHAGDGESGGFGTVIVAFPESVNEVWRKQGTTDNSPQGVNFLPGKSIGVRKFAAEKGVGFGANTGNNEIAYAVPEGTGADK